MGHTTGSGSFVSDLSRLFQPRTPGSQVGSGTGSCAVTGPDPGAFCKVCEVFQTRLDLEGVEMRHVYSSKANTADA